ncbi:MAG: DUF2167 domain-containing protein [Oleiphilaceae bacterium]|nr:DUF2167 domain-containing protein [Oleiphilaceae bacterium]
MQSTNRLWGLFALLLTALSLSAQAEQGFTEEQALSEEEQAYIAWAQEFHASLDFQHGEIALPNGVATLNVPEQFYYLSPEDADRVLVDAWGNPPGQPTLGMLFPAHVSPLDGASWGVTIAYQEDGYVSDEDAADIDYSELLADMQDETRAYNQERIDAGYPPIELLGWASKPHYDATTHKLYWARELQFGDEPEHTLNYNIRALGRQGVLVLNFIAGMDQLPEIEANLDAVLAMAEFDQGHRYEDFNPDIDKVAAYGIGALVAGKVATKAGIFAAILIFLKKFGVIILAGVAALAAKLYKNRKSS